MAKTLAETVKGVKVKPKRTEPVWKGPEKDGVTFSLLSRFLVCRERFRLLVVEGWKTADRFNPLIEYGNLWHTCEEALAANGDWEQKLMAHGYELVRKYPMQQQDVEHWYKMCLAEFPYYCEHWAKHPDVKERIPLLQEHVFDVPYLLPSGRTVRLRGKFDAVDVIGKGKDAGIYIQENKTKSQVDAGKIGRQVTYDLQSMMYDIALRDGKHSKDGWAKYGPVAGVRYNVVRRPAHKSPESMVKKIEDDRSEGRIGEWFSRWRVEISDQDIKLFRRETLDPILEQLCDWWEVVSHAAKPFETTGDNMYLHFRYPYGVWNPMLENATGDLDSLMNEGSTVGLKQVDNLFPELETP